MKILLNLTLFFALAGLSLAQVADQDSLVEVRLVREYDTIQPGKPWLLGVEFTMKPQWHIYWKNPGQAGLATEIDYQVPEGVLVKPLEFPTPKSFDQGGGVIGYGYEDKVLFLAELTVDPQAGCTDEIPIQVSSFWLSCKDRCVLGEKELPLTVKLANYMQASPDKKLLNEWRQALPKTLKHQKLLSIQVAEPLVKAEQLNQLLTLTWAQAPGKLKVFPYLADQSLTLDEIQTTHVDQTSRIDLRLSIPKDGVPPKAAAELLLKSEELGAFIVPVTFAKRRSL